MSAKIILVVAAFLAISVAQDQCSSDYQYFEGSCYTLGPTNYDFDEARRNCENLDAYLVVITSQAENEFVKGLVNTSAYDTETGAYIGAQKGYRSLVWQWQDTREDLSFTDWSRPSKRQYRRVGVCASLNRNQDWGWVEQNCNIAQNMTSVCEKCPVQKACFQGSCYEILCRAALHKDVEEACEANGGYVLEINSEEENKFIKGFLNGASVPKSRFDDSKNVWVGLNDDAEEGKFVWMSNGEIPGYTNWASGEPNNMGINGLDENCVVLNANSDWKWNDIMCFSDHAVVCESADPSGVSG